MAQQMMGVIGQDNGFMRELDRIKSEDSESDSFVTILHEDSSGNSGSADLHEDNTDASGFSGHESEHKFHGMDPPHSRQRRSAPSPEIPGDVMQIESGNKSSKISSPQAGDRTYHENSEPSAHDDKGIDSKLAAFKERAGEPTSLRAYNSYYENPHYVDLEDPQLSDAYAKRLQAMHDKNAEESRHHRIPPKDAPPHMQVMVVLYQWAAWALEISNDKLRGRLIKWVNGRFLDFMMSGGRIPGYNLKELLEIAGVDARELYGYQRVTNMSSNQLPATISGEQETQLQPGLENVEANMEPGFNQVDHASSAAKDASYEEDDGAIVFTDNDDDDEEDDMGKSGRNPAKHASTNGNTFRNRDGPPLPVEEAMLHEGSGAIANNRKREAVSDEDMDQVSHVLLFPMVEN